MFFSFLILFPEFLDRKVQFKIHYDIVQTDIK